MKRFAFSLATVFAVSFGAQGAVIHDPVGDFIPTYTGPLNGDLDVVRAEVFFDGKSFLFTSTSAAPIGTTPEGVFVWGIDRGAGFATFPGIAEGVTFDALLAIVPSGGSLVIDLATNTQTALAADAVYFTGGYLAADVPLYLLPSLGSAPRDYTVNLWPRSALLFEDQVISDFAPDNSNAGVTLTPEPASMGLLGSALGGLALMRLRKRHQQN